MLPARYRMTRSTEFGATVSQGVRAVQPDLVVHALRSADGDRRRRTPHRSGGLEIRWQRGTTAPGGPSAAPCGAHDDRRTGPRGPGGHPGAAEQPARHLGAARTGTADGIAPDPAAKRGAALMAPWFDDSVGSARRCRGVIFLIELYRHTVSPMRLPTCRFSPTCSQYAVEALTEYGLDPGRLAGGGAAAEVRAVASGRMGPDTRAPRRLALHGARTHRPHDLWDSPALRGESEYACLIGSASTSSTGRCRRSCGSGTRRSPSCSARRTSSPGRCR